MADVQTTDSRARQMPKRGSPKRTPIRIDFTPMVDLGFLLITFFMLTTVLAKPQIMPVVMPEEDMPTQAPAVKSSTVLTLLLGDHNKVYWYEGIDNPRLDSTDYGPGGLRRIILDKKARVYQMWGDEVREDHRHQGNVKSVSQLTILIKPTPGSRYKNVVDALDEMKICGISRYVLLRVSNQELAFIQAPMAGLQFSAADQLAAATRRQ